MEEVKIGKQVWMKINLNVDKFQNGEIIPEAKTDEEWKKAGENQEPAWCYYDYNPVNGDEYGKLYNWYAVNDSRRIAPNGWHVPTNKEWLALIKFLGGEDVMGDKVKNVYKHHWEDPKNIATNESGFSGLPGGYRYYLGIFANLGSNGNWWSASELNISNAYFLYLLSNSSKGYFHHDEKRNGFSLRCVRD